MVNLMDNYYSSLKENSGLKEINKSDQDEYQLNEVFRKIKPNTTTNNFKDFISST